LSISETALRLGVGANTIRRWVKTGSLRAVQPGGEQGVLRFTVLHNLVVKALEDTDGHLDAEDLQDIQEEAERMTDTDCERDDLGVMTESEIDYLVAKSNTPAPNQRQRQELPPRVAEDKPLVKAITDAFAKVDAQRERDSIQIATFNC
jgi:excisionase family DNA binding protein